MRGARVPYQNPMISYCKTAPDQICRRAPNGRPCQAISRQKSAGRKCAEESAAFDYQEFEDIEDGDLPSSSMFTGMKRRLVQELQQSDS